MRFWIEIFKYAQRGIVQDAWGVDIYIYISELPTRVWEMRVASYEFIRICVVHVYACVRLHSIFRVAQTRCLHCLICILKCVFWQLIVTVWNCVLVLFDRTENTHLTSHCTAVVSWGTAIVSEAPQSCCEAPQSCSEAPQSCCEAPPLHIRKGSQQASLPARYQASMLPSSAAHREATFQGEVQAKVVFPSRYVV